MAKSPQPSVEDLARALKSARERGQQVVPIVGAGLSADCGFPVITAVVRYFGKLYKYITMRGPLYDYSKLNNPSADFFDRHFKEYELEPWKFLEDFGWPDLFQLNEDLLMKLEHENANKKVKVNIDEAVRDGLDSLVSQFNQNGEYQYTSLRNDVSKILSELKKQHPELPELQRTIEGFEKKINSRFENNQSNSATFDVIGDWRRLILYFTNYRSDHADVLFARFGATRKPGQGHRFLAFLSKILVVQTILTFNFDSLIEEALDLEGIRYKVFAMERGADLPHQNLLRDQLSVIKAHGSTHALLLDEQLDRPLSKEYLDRFDNITGENPILLVIGCSAGDRRLRDLVSRVLDSSKQRLSVAWLHYESTPPLFLRDGEELRWGVCALPTNNPGATLLHLYSSLMNSNPVSRVPYLAHAQQPIELAADGSSQSKGDSSHETAEGQFDWIAVSGSKFFTASQILLKRANEWARQGYQIIWIDLKSLHTFAGVIGSIIDQCRKYDPDLAPSLLSVDIDQIGGEGSGDAKFLTQIIKQMAKRVIRVLRRARYYLAIDSLCTYTRLATTHHGLTSPAISHGAKRRVKSIFTFLKTLEKDDLGGSRVGVAVDRPTNRYKDLNRAELDGFEDLFTKAKEQGLEPEFNPGFDFADHFSQLRDDLPIFSLTDIPRELKEILATGSKQEITDCRPHVAMVLFCLSCFRRPHPLVATIYLLQPLLGEAFTRHGLQDFLKVFTGQGYFSLLQQLEGGGYWFNPSIRDDIYRKNTEHTDTMAMWKCLNRKPSNQTTAEYRQNAVFQLFLSTNINQRISKIYYDTFVQSRDAFAFLEYTYHRVSSIRNLVKLRALAVVGETDERIAKDLVKGIAKCAELIRSFNENDPPFKQLGFGEDGPFGEVLRNRHDDSFRRDWCSEAKEIQKSLGRRHRRQLHGLYSGWTRAEVILRTQVPAEQLLHWCDKLLNELVNHCNRLVLSYRNTSAKTRHQGARLQFYNFGSKTAPNYFIDRELEAEGKDLKEFRWLLQDLQVKLWIERSDYETCIRHRRKHLWHGLHKTSAPTREDIENSQEVIDRCSIRQCHQLLNIANCKLKLQQELTSDERGLRDVANSVLVLLNNIKQRLQCLTPNTRGGPSSETNEHNEAWLRLLHLQAEAQIGHVSVFSHDGFTGDPQDWAPRATDIGMVLITIAQGLDEIGGRYARAPGTDATLYLQYRSLFSIFKGRTEWLCDPENRGDGLEKALHWFELARGGLEKDSSPLSALIEIYETEVFLARGRAILFQMKSGNEFPEAQEMYDSARVTLRRARDLVVSHRHLMWQKLFFCITTQYYSDRLLLRYAILQESALTQLDRSVETKNRQYFEKNAREALLKLRRAYQTLVSALDLYPPLSARHDPAYSNRFRWLYRMWWELTLCGYGTGRVVIKALQGENRDDDQAHDYVIRQLKWLNNANRVDESALKEAFKKNAQVLRGQYEKSSFGSDGEYPLVSALNRRRNLINQVNELSKDIQNGSRT